ncbi:fasciclin domain-containing protein [Haloarcula salina]|uniref:fasciclin domain-containing protein n=1 Tax=Haloarcula salina TaxID=1429914 RepID=UPI003C6FCA60
MTDHDRRRVLKALGTTGALLATGGVGAVSAKRDGASGDDSLVDLAIDLNTGQFDVLIAALQANPDVLDTLDGRGQYTVFAPTDAAFGDAGFTEANADEVPASVLTYHVTPGRRYSESVLGAPRLPTLNGAFIEQDDGVLNGGQATITDTDYEASNGVLHVIDGVLLP